MGLEVMAGSSRGQEKGHANLFRVAEAPKTTSYQAHPRSSGT